MTQERASTTLDLPDPFGPTTQVMPGSKRSVVAEAKDLNPLSVRLLRCTPPDSTARLPARPGPSGGDRRHRALFLAVFFGFTGRNDGHIRR
jgi:hypothetical protein